MATPEPTKPPNGLEDSDGSQKLIDSAVIALRHRTRAYGADLVRQATVVAHRRGDFGEVIGKDVEQADKAIRAGDVGPRRLQRSLIALSLVVGAACLTYGLTDVFSDHRCWVGVITMVAGIALVCAGAILQDKI